MKNIMVIDKVKAVVQFDPEIEMFRGEFIGLNGGGDFYADNVEDLKREGKTTLDVFLQTCQENNIEPFKEYSGRFNARISPESHKTLEEKAKSEGISLNLALKKAVELYVHQ